MCFACYCRNIPNASENVLEIINAPILILLQVISWGGYSKLNRSDKFQAYCNNKFLDSFNFILTATYNLVKEFLLRFA